MKNNLDTNEPILEESKHEEEDHDDLNFQEETADNKKTVKF